MLFSSVSFSQTVSAENSDETLEYMPRINEATLTGTVKRKLTGMKNGNPVNFIVIKKKTITVWDVAFFDSIKVGDKVSLEGLVPLQWKPDFSGAIDAPSKSVVAKGVNK